MADAADKAASTRARLSFSRTEVAAGLVLLLLPVLVASCDTPHTFSVNPVGTSYFPIRLITGQATGPSVYLATVAYLFCIAAIGEALFLVPLQFDQQRSRRPFRLLAGFVPGYILTSAFNRVVTLFLSHRTAPVMIASSTLLVLILILIHPQRVRPDQRVVGTDGGDGPFAACARWISSLLLLWMVTVFFLQRQVDHVTGDAFVFLDSLLKSPVTGIGTGGRLAVISQHYDELSVLYPLLYGVYGRFAGEPLVCFWMLYGFFATGAICLVYGCARQVGLSPLESVMVLLVLFFGMYSVYPGNNAYVLFDSSNPLAQCLHPGRIFGALMPVAALTMFMNRRRLMPPQSPRTLLLSAVLGIGIGTTTISNVVVLAFLTVFWIIGLLLQEHEFRPGRGLIDGQRELILARLLYLYPFVCCLSPEVKRSVSPYLLLFIVAALCAFLAVMVGESANREKDIFTSSFARVSSSPIFIGGATGLGISLLLLGNIFIEKVASHLGSHDSIWDIPILTRRLYTLEPVGLLNMMGPYESSGYFPLEHTFSPPEFIAHFGLIFIIATATFYLWSKLRENGSSPGDATDSVPSLLLFSLLFILAFLVGLFGYDFMAANVKAEQFLAVWLRSRLVEPWFYAIIFTSLVLQRRLFRGRGGLIFFTLFTIYLTKDMLIYPGVAVRQWLINAGFFFDKII